MELDLNLVRKLLLHLESKPDNSSMDMHEMRGFCEKNNVSANELTYVIERLNEANYINATVKHGSDRVVFVNINSITYQGHEFISSISDDKVWQETQKKISKVGKVTLPIVQNIATSIIKKIMGLS